MRYLKATDEVAKLRRLDGSECAVDSLVKYVMIGMSCVSDEMDAAVLVHRPSSVLEVDELLGDRNRLGELLDVIPDAMEMVGVRLMTRVCSSEGEEALLKAHGWTRYGTMWVENGPERPCMMLVVDCGVKETDWVC